MGIEIFDEKLIGNRGREALLKPELSKLVGLGMHGV